MHCLSLSKTLIKLDSMLMLQNWPHFLFGREAMAYEPIQGMELVVATVSGYRGSERQNLIKFMTHAGVLEIRRQQNEEPEAYHIRTLASVLGSEEAAKEALIYSYKTAASGFSAKLTPQQVAEISRMAI